MPRRLVVLAFLAAFFMPSLARADGAFLARLPQNAGAPVVERPVGEDAVVGIRLEIPKGEKGRVTTFGQVFRRGDVPAGQTLMARVEGRRVPLQVDAKARHADGSLRHAILSLRNPATSTVQIALHAVPDGKRGDLLDIREVLGRGYDLTIMFDFNGPQVTLDVAKLLQKAVNTDPARWLQGPLASEVRIKRRLTPQLTAIFDIRALADGAVRTAVSLHNDAMTETNNLDLKYSYTIRMSGQTMAESAITHRRYANWREVIWAGAPPSSAHVIYDYPYLIAAGAVPAYDPALPPSPAFLRRGVQDMGRADAALFGNALIEKDMRAAAQVPGAMGLLPDWSLAWLRSQSPGARHVMMQNAAAAGSVPWHLRDPKTKAAPQLDAHPAFWMDARATPDTHGHGPVETDIDGWRVDAAQGPDLAYLPYLISGDRYFLDELHAQLAAALFAHNPAKGFRDGAEGALRGATVLAQAGANRTHGFAVWITPDDHPEKAYLAETLRKRLLWYAATYRQDDALGGPAGAETAGWIAGKGARGVLAPWQQDAFAASLAQIARMSFGESGAVFNFMRPHLLGRFLREDFHPGWATAPRLVYGDRGTGTPYRRWAEIVRASLAARAIASPPRAQAGDPASATGAAAQARAGYAAMLGSFADPLMAESYATLVRNTLAMQQGPRGFAANPRFSIVPVFPDGTTLPLANHLAVSGRAEGTPRNDLLAGSPRPDMILGGGGNDIIAGLDGNDTVAGGSGFNLLAGGRGDDRIVAEGGITIAAGGPGADTFYVGRRATGGAAPLGRLEIVDFTPGQDRLSLPPPLGSPAAILRRAQAVEAGTLIPLGQGGSILLRGIAPGQIRPESLAMR